MEPHSARACDAPRHRAALLLSAPLGGEAGAGLIVEAFLRWCLGAVSGSPGEGGTTVTAEQVRHLAAALRDRELTDSLFTLREPGGVLREQPAPGRRRPGRRMATRTRWTAWSSPSLPSSRSGASRFRSGT
ncbi:hypothetical protein IHE61_20890 [Streptomyces sp. GKU 257-1]|nr:hypothetical protein [Streptomyces sp. GKU 257-1]